MRSISSLVAALLLWRARASLSSARRMEVGRPSLTAREEVQARYPISEENANSYAEGEPVELKVNKLTSSKTLYPVGNYLLPFCQPWGGPKMDRQNLGQFLVGDRIESSPYRLRMKEDMYCEQLCISNLGRGERKGLSPNKMVRAIRKNYHSNWIVDGIPAASVLEDDSTVTTRYWGGSPVGFIASDTRKSYVHNHVNIVIHYNSLATDPGKYRVVRVLVEPFSIKHDFVASADDDGGSVPEGQPKQYKVADIQNPIESCNPKIHRLRDHTWFWEDHTRYEMVYARGREPQPASGRVLFTYDVIWTENKDVSWASRWDVYLTMDYAIPDQVHWMSIANSAVIVMLLLAMIAATLVRNLRHLASYKRITSDEEKAERIIGFGWQLLHRDVFRPPSSSPLLLAACCGTGFQLLCTAFETALLPVLGFIHPSEHGTLIVAMLVLFAVNGSMAGYVSARVYCLFCRHPQEKGVREVVKHTVFGFPGITFGCWLLVNILALAQRSFYAVPVTNTTIVVCLWLCILAPLAFLGAHIGYKQGALFDLPSARGPPPRRVPAQPLLRRLPFSIIAAGMLHFGCIFVEFYFLHASLLTGQYCPFFGFQLVVMAILIVTSALTSSILNYYVLCGGSEYRWWWRSFGVGGSGGVVLFVYACMHVGRGSLSLSFSTHLLYLGCMGLMALALFLMTGVVGLVASFGFNKMLYGPIIASRQMPEEEDTFWIDALGEKIEAGSSSDRTANKKWLLCAGMVVLFLPAVFYPHEIRVEESEVRQRSSDVASDGSLQAQGDYIVGEAESVGDKIHRTESPHQFGIASSHLLAGHGELATAIVALLWVAVIVCTIVVKRRSSRPGGAIYLYNQRKVREIMAQKRWHLREMLKDPVLLQGMEARFGDLSSLRLIADSRWAPDKKEEGVKLWKKILLVPWIRNMNAFLFLIASTTYFGVYGEALSPMLLALVLVHLVDNLLLYKAAIAKGAPKIAETEGLFAAVGVPVIEVV